MAYLLDHSLGSLNDLGLQPMGSRQDFQPLWNMEIHLRYRKFLQHLFQNMEYIVFFQLFTVYRKHRYAITFRHLSGQFGCLIGIWFHGIEKDYKRFSQLFKFINGLLFSRHVPGSFDLANGAVCGHHDPYGGVVVDDFSGA